MNPFETESLGTTDVTVPRLGLGTAPLGGWPSNVSQEQADNTITEAWDQGIRYFDTAPFYGHGFSEKRLGAVLGEVDRSRFTLSTKVGRLLKPGDGDSPLFEGTPNVDPVFDFSREGVRQSIQESRERLGFEEIDIAFIHDPDDHHEEALQSAYPALAELRESGELKAIGVGMNWSEPLADFARNADFDAFLVAGRYTLLEQGAMDDLLPTVQEQGASIIAGGVYNSGLLVDPGPDATYDYQPADEDVLEQALSLQATCAEFDVPLRAAALQFPLAHPAVPSIVVGARNPHEVRDNLEMLQRDIPSDLWKALKDRGQIRSDVPVPES